MSLTVVYPDAVHLSAFRAAPWFAGWEGFAEALTAEHEALEAELIAHRGEEDWGDPPALARPATAPEHMRFALEVVVRTLRGMGVGLIASAGNERQPGTDAPPTLYPAAYDEVVGVGALASLNDKTMSAVTQVATATYSCRADKPPHDGFLVMGGDTAGNVASDTDGIVGIWVDSNIPDPASNARVPSAPGWARWAGTSFAAPIITGAVAALMRNGEHSFAESLQILHEAWNEVSNPQSLAEVPQVVLVQQAPRQPNANEPMA
jgi:subtilisin family serine protease